MRELLPSGKQTVFYSRVGWTGTYVAKAGLGNLTLILPHYRSWSARFSTKSFTN
ncbi:winged helix-turn-helix domain-containing protein [Chloroflexus sp.]|uniref:winged helix-turn-helix domain-containing protein n=1 Tax=Chloroflexus sp. TaxID=1904827 RepID=UPI00404A5537